MAAITHQKLAQRSGVAFFIAALALVVYWLVKPNPLTSGASGMAIAFRDGDGAALLRASIVDERSCSELTPEKLHKVWQILIEPIITSSRLVGPDKTVLETNQTQATAGFKYVDKRGNPWKLTAIVNQAQEGTKTEVVYMMLATASLFDDDGNANATLTPDLSLRGIHRFRAQLEAAGITRLMLGPGTCVSWDQLTVKLQPHQ